MEAGACTVHVPRKVGQYRIAARAWEMDSFFTYIRRHKAGINEDFGGALAFCNVLASDISKAGLPDRVRDAFLAAGPDDRDYAISSAYALLMGTEQRKALSAYFTPPGLTSAVLDAASNFIDGVMNPAVLDPACGGGSFLTPMARFLIHLRGRQGNPTPEACRNALRQLRGIEIDTGLATLSQALLRKMLAREYDYRHTRPLGVVKRGDALSVSLQAKFDLVIGNPPYGKVRDRLEDKILKTAGRANLGGHTNLYSLFLLRGLNWLKPGGGLVFVLPTSFVAGPYFAGLRHEVFSRAFVERIDLHEQRENLFLGAVQDICLLMLRRREEGDDGTGETSHPYELGYIDAGGMRTRRGTALARSGGEPWTLPVAHEVRVFSHRTDFSLSSEGKAFTLSDYGYRTRVGTVVPTRERKRLHTNRRKGDMPLLWASSIRPDGSFDFEAARRLRNALWYCPPNEGSVAYASSGPAVIVQRTSNRNQSRRLNAAMVPKRFRDEYAGGFVAENHVIVIEAMAGRPALPPSILVKVLNAGATNERFSAVSGSFSVSAGLLQRLALPDPATVKALKPSRFEHGLRKLFDELGDILAHAESSKASRDAENTVDKPCDLESGLTVNEHSRLERGAIT